MPKKVTTKAVSKEGYRTRLEQAQGRIENATLLATSTDSQDSAAVLAVQGAIAAADALTTYFLEERCSSQRHEDAVQVLKRLKLDGIQAAGTNLARILSQKSTIEYGMTQVKSQDAKKLVERARKFVEYASQRIADAQPGK